MKCVLKYPPFHLLTIALLAAFASPYSVALTSDTNQPVTVDSQQQSVDIKNNIATFTGNVVIKQGTIKIQADKVIIKRPSKSNNNGSIEAYGHPVKFYQMQDNGKPISGHSLKLNYELNDKVVILIGDAFVSQLDSNINGEKITYSVKNQFLQAFSGANKRVSTILNPTQLQEPSTASTKKKS